MDQIKRHFLSLNETPVLIEPLCTVTTVTQKRALFVIHSSVDHFEYRSVIRETWGRKSVLDQLFNGSQIIFVLGKSQDQRIENQVDWEAEYYCDILKGGNSL